MHVAQQRVEARGGQGRSHQAENAQRCKANHHVHDQGHAVGQVTEHFTGGCAGMADGHAHADRPRQDADEVRIHQGADRVVDHAQQQALQDFANAAGRADSHVVGGEHEAGREQGAGDHRNGGGTEGAEQVQEQNRSDMGFLAVLVVGDRGHDQHEHQNWRDGFECADKHFADECGGLRHFRREQRQDDTGNQANHDLGDQAGAFESLQERKRCCSHSGISDFFKVL
ncbi:hypothetical protein D3C78_629380 [compost metagenome]